MKCRNINCGKEIADGSKFCSKCRSKIEDQGKTCSNSDCNRKGLPSEAMFCPDCGTKLLEGIKSDSFPVIHVSWNDAIAFCNWLSKQTGKPYRLSTVAEWEYAAGFSPNSNNERFIWAGTNKSLELNDYAWFNENSNNQIHPVAQKKPNCIGLYDMLGNVWEWCQDWYDMDHTFKAPLKNPTGPLSGEFKIIKGGSFTMNANSCKITNSDVFMEINDRTRWLGFRLALTL